MKKVLITGADGFVAKHLIAILEEYNVIGTYNTQPADIKRDNLSFQPLDILNRNEVERIISEEKPDIIVHLAAVATTWADNPQDIFKVNLEGTLNLYATVAKEKGNSGYNPKILFASSGTIYGKASNPESVNENSLLLPLNFYATSKAAADRLSYQYSQSHNLNIVIVRAFNLAGPGQGKGFFVSDICSQIAKLEISENDELLVGNTSTIRDYLDVRDAVLGYKALIESDTPAGEAFNLCSSIGYKIQDLLDILLGLSNKSLTVKNDPQKMKRSEAPVFVGDNTKLKQTTGWAPSIKIEQTLKDTLDYWRQNK